MSQSIQVSFVQEGDVYTVHTGSSVLKDIIMDYTGSRKRSGAATRPPCSSRRP